MMELSVSGRLDGLNLVSNPIWVFNLDTSRIAWANAAALQLWGAADSDELFSRDLAADMSASVSRRLTQYRADFQADDSASFREQWTLYPAGEPVLIRMRLTGIPLPEGQMGMFCEAHHVDETNPEAIRSVDALLHTAAMISLYSEDGVPLYRNPAAREAVHDSHVKLADRFQDAQTFEAFLATVRREGSSTQTIGILTAQGHRWHEISARYCHDAVSGQDALLLSELDVSSIKLSEAHAQFLAEHDNLTGLPNRSQVILKFDECFGNGANEGQEAALVFLDLDHFKDVNDTMGHAAGDRLLVVIANRLRSAIRIDDLVARVGGDEFLILMIGERLRSELTQLQERIMQAVSEPVSINGQEVYVTPSLGVSLYPNDSNDIASMMRNADLAMYKAKELGRNKMAFYDQGMSVELRERKQLENQLRQAFERSEFSVHYQAIVDVITRGVVGAEALVRWNHPVRGMVSPDEFIPLCEQNGMIHELGIFVFEEAVRQQVAWAQKGLDIRVSVNLSATQLRQSELLRQLQVVVAQCGGNASRIQLELTESMLLGRDEDLVDRLRQLRAFGFSIALDDFGTGYSNLAYLQRYPLQTLKIDRSFIQTIPGDDSLAKMIVSLCRILRLTAVAEGVETPEQFAWVKQHGIELCQGFLFARPCDAATFTARNIEARAKPDLLSVN